MDFSLSKAACASAGLEEVLTWLGRRMELISGQIVFSRAKENNAREDGLSLAMTVAERLGQIVGRQVLYTVLRTTTYIWHSSHC
jgi:hypothetical protein